MKILPVLKKFPEKQKIANNRSIKWGGWTCVVTFWFKKIMNLSTFVFYYQFKMFCRSPKEFFSIESKFGKNTKNQPYISETVVEILISQVITLSSLVAIGLVKINIWLKFICHVTSRNIHGQRDVLLFCWACDA